VRIHEKVKECLENADELVLQSLDILDNQINRLYLNGNNKIPSKESIKNRIKKSKNKANNLSNDESLHALNSDANSKQKFKGSDFIFQRFKWDPNIDREKITIGYLDRFKGIIFTFLQKKKFSFC
jgi:hypothetical protein